MTSPNYAQAISALSASLGQDAYLLLQNLQSALNTMNAQIATVPQSFSSWLTQYQQAFAEADRAARFAVVNCAVVGNNPTVIGQLQTAFGVGSLGSPAPLAFDSSNATAGLLLLRTNTAQALTQQPNAVPANATLSLFGISQWISAAQIGANTSYAAKPGGTDPTQTPAYLAAVASLASAWGAANAFLSAASFQ
jgi:hypothetical protein